VEPAFSPDGRWLAYEGSESGSYEVYVRPFPGPGGKWQISTGGGVLPKWSRNGRELFYRTLDSKIMVVSYTAAGDSFHAISPALVARPVHRTRAVQLNFDLYPDGKRFAVLKARAQNRPLRRTRSASSSISSMSSAANSRPFTLSLERQVL